jgi:phosphoadenosine phosphosulfate reductase
MSSENLSSVSADNAKLLAQYQKEIAGLSANEILSWCWKTFGTAAVFTSSLGAEDQVLIDMIAEQAPQFPVATIDTGRLPEETYAVMEAVKERYGLIIQDWFPDKQAVEQMVNDKGPNLFYRSIDNRKLCCNVRKVQVLNRILAGKRAWVSGLRRSQGQTRASTELIEYDAARDLFKIHPLVEWSQDDVWAWIKSRNVPYNALHDAGYPSIGCAPCTRAITAGEDERAGRWWWEAPENKECGLHVDPAAPKRPVVIGIGQLKGL